MSINRKRAVVLLVATFFSSMGMGGVLNRSEGTAGEGPAAREDALPIERPTNWDTAAPTPPLSARDIPMLNCRLPAEFEHHRALLIACRELIDVAPELFLDIVWQTRETIRIVALVSDAEEYDTARELLTTNAVRHRHVQFVELTHDTMWIRDYGPIVVQPAQGGVAVIDAGYQLDRQNDDRVPHALAELLNLPVVRMPLRLDGGNLICNGNGLGLTTSRLLEENAESQQDEQEVAEVLRRVCGLSEVIVLEPLADEPTGHVDMFATFTATNSVVVGAYDPAIDAENAAILDRNAARLEQVQTPRGPLHVTRIPMPSHHDDVWRTHTNVIYANGVLLVPTYDGQSDDNDDARARIAALETFASLLPRWRVVGVDASQIVDFSGALHCISMNLGLLEQLPTFPEPHRRPAAVPEHVMIDQVAPADDTLPRFSPLEVFRPAEDDIFMSLPTKHWAPLSVEH